MWKLFVVALIASGSNSFVLNKYCGANTAYMNNNNGSLFHSSSLFSMPSDMETTDITNRRDVLKSVATGLLFPSLVMGSEASNALDMDAFINSELEKDNKQRDLTDDEALCKYGNSGKDRGEACSRAGLSTSSKKKGAVDSYGNIDRGDFVRCKTSYPMINGKYVKTITCE